jgi:molecular chaperone DnaJ
LKNSFEILGIKQNASDAEVKKAYRDLVKQYHPDQYQNNPLSKLAEEKLREINGAYDSIMSSRNGGRGSGKGFGGGTGRAEFASIRMNINSGNISEAERELEMMSDRGSEWYYLMGLVFLRKGWYGEAKNHVQRAVQMDPTNIEYRSTLARIENTAGGFRQNANSRGYNQGPDMCQICGTLWCMDSCCECMGGDCISCC